MEQKNRTLDTALGMQRTLRLNGIRLKVYCPESLYENGRRSFVSGRRLVHRETQRPVRLYFIASWVHSSSAHSHSFRHNVFATNEHGFIKPYMDQQSKESSSLRPRSGVRKQILHPIIWFMRIWFRNYTLLRFPVHSIYMQLPGWR